MVSPSPEWEDTENGYRCDGLTLTAHPVSGEQYSIGDLQEPTGTVVEAYEDGDVSHEIATFADAETAREFTKLLTWYLDVTDTGPDGPMRNLKNLINGGDPLAGEDQWTPPPLIEEMTAGDVLEKMDTSLTRSGATVAEIREAVDNTDDP